MARILLAARAMARASLFVLTASFVLAGLSVVGCSSSCTDIYRYHSVEMSRELAVSGASSTLLVEACFGTECQSASAAPSGELSFAAALGHDGPSGGSVETLADPARRRITVTYTVGERSNKVVGLRVRQGDATLLDETVAIRWEDEGCHPEPLSTKL